MIIILRNFRKNLNALRIMVKDFILDNNKNIIVEIEYQFHRELLYKNVKYTHYMGEIMSSFVFEVPLKELLSKKKKMIDEGVFFTDELDEKINNLNLSLQKLNKKILNLYVENKNIDFYVQADQF